MRTYQIDDEGDYLELHLLQDGDKIGGMLMDIEPIGLDQAFALLDVVGGLFVCVENFRQVEQYEAYGNMPAGSWKQADHGTH